MRKTTILFLAVCMAISCGKKQEENTNGNDGNKNEVAKSGSTNVTGVGIDSETYGVKLKENRSHLEASLKEKGEKWEIINDGMFVKVDKSTDYCGTSFDAVTFVLTNDNVNMTTLSKKFYNKEEAAKAYNVVLSQVNSKYGKLKKDQSNDEELSFTQYKDQNTDLSVFLIHHPKEDAIAEAENEAAKSQAKEYWEVDVSFEVIESTEKMN